MKIECRLQKREIVFKLKMKGRYMSNTNCTKVGIIGCGSISSAYCKGIRMFNNLELKACADIIPERAKQLATEFNIAKACSVEELLKDDEIKIVINLTLPKVHYEVSMAILDAGKHAYQEKPLALNTREGKEIIEKAKSKKLRIGCAPDTFLGAGIQTCRKIVDDGWVGKPIGAVAFVLSPGHESWHPSPEFYYKIGGGPMMDMGPYYITALVNLLGPVQKIYGTAKQTHSERVITSQPEFGKIIKVEVPTHYFTTLEFVNGALCNMIMSFDCKAANSLPRIEIYGTNGTLRVPDPNSFGGTPMLTLDFKMGFKEFPPVSPYTEYTCRGIGVADMAAAIAAGRPHRANGELAYHVLEIMEAATLLAGTDTAITIKSRCSKPDPLPLGLSNGRVE
jgi:predicted dehydrogenase